MKKVNKCIAMVMSVVLLCGLFPMAGYAEAPAFVVDEFGTLTAYNGSWRSVTITEDVVEIGAGVFKTEHQITDIIILGDFIYLGENAFSECDQLTDIYFYSPYAMIEPTAFAGLEQLTIHGLNDSMAETFAKQQGFDFEPLPVWTDEQTGISVQTKPYQNATLQVNHITSGEMYDSLAAELTPLDCQFALYEIQLLDANNVPYPVDAATLVTIPRPESFGRLNMVFHIDTNTFLSTVAYTGMDSQMVCQTEGLGLFLVTSVPYLNGDIDMNASITTTDARILLQYAVGKINTVDYLMLVFEPLKESLSIFYPDVDWEEVDEETFREILEMLVELDETLQTSEFKKMENFLHGLFDVNNDGKISTTDARLTLQLAVGKISDV